MGSIKSQHLVVDKVSAEEFAENLDGNITRIVDDLKGNRYHEKCLEDFALRKGTGNYVH